MTKTSKKVFDNMNKVFTDFSKYVNGLAYDSKFDSQRIAYANKKERTATRKFEIDRWTDEDNVFDGYGLYIGKDNVFSEVGHVTSMGENRSTKGGSYERKKQYYIWIRTQNEYDAVLYLIQQLVTASDVKFESTDIETVETPKEPPKKRDKGHKTRKNNDEVSQTA